MGNTAKITNVDGMNLGECNCSEAHTATHQAERKIGKDGTTRMNKQNKGEKKKENKKGLDTNWSQHGRRSKRQ